MQNRLIFDSTSNGLGDQVNINVGPGPMGALIHVEDAVDDAMNIVVGKRLENSLNPLAAKTQNITNYYLDDTQLIATTQEGAIYLPFDGNYNAFIGYVAGNDQSKRVRIWIVYNDNR